MKTKLVYVLTCAPEATYIEQALMSVYSARHYNPDATIVLMVDDKTDALLIEKRAEILNYISEKVVVSFDDESLTPMYRSRWIKTKVRELIKGDFLFIDSDTIIQRSLADIDTFECEVGAVLESHLTVCEFNDSLLRSARNANEQIGVDVDTEQLYYSSGVLLVKDTKKTHKLYELWHQYWKEGNEIGLKIDQPSLAKANREVGHIINRIPDTYNCILFTRPIFIREAHILHIAAYLNPSFLFAERVLNYVKENGIANEWLQKMILHPCATIMPFDYMIKHSTCKERRIWSNALVDAWKGYGENIDANYSDIPSDLHLLKRDVRLLKTGFAKLAFRLHLAEMKLRLMRKKIKSNYCQR